MGLEVCGYAGRIGQALNPFDGNTFLLFVSSSKRGLKDLEH